MNLLAFFKKMSVELTEKNAKAEKAVDGEAPLSTPPASLLELFSMASKLDILYMMIGTFCAFLGGISIPIFNFLFGEMLDNVNSDPDSFDKAVEETAILFAIVGGISVFIGTIQIYGWTVAGERQAQRFRERYVDAILR